MKYEYVVLKNVETGEVEVLGRFHNGVGEMFSAGKWETAWELGNLMFDGLLDDISEVDAQHLKAQMSVSQLQPV
jgi:hypothetical protein